LFLIFKPIICATANSTSKSFIASAQDLTTSFYFGYGISRLHKLLSETQLLLGGTHTARIIASLLAFKSNKPEIMRDPKVCTTAAETQTKTMCWSLKTVLGWSC